MNQATQVHGVVNRVEHGMAIIDVAVPKGCGRCDEPGGCGGGLAVGGAACSRSYQMPDAVGVAAGDEVVLTVPAGGVLRAAAWAYGIPLLLGLAGAMGGAAAAADERLSIGGGLAGLILGFVLLGLQRRRAAPPMISMALKHSRDGRPS